MAGIGCLFLFLHQPPPAASGITPRLAPIPGNHRRAFLVPADGQEIELRPTESTVFLDSHGIRYADGTYAYREKQTAHRSTIYTVRTPAGGQYEVVLPDGSLVRLNAVSRLQIPVRSRPRSVTMEGEGHFVVAADRSIGGPAPFSVRTRSQEIQVLGTEFSVSAYADEPDIQTTLYNGAVRVRTDQGGLLQLRPGEQAALDPAGHLRRQAADTVSSPAWQTGYIDLRNKPIRQVLRELSRWYGLDVQYEAEVPEIILHGKFPVTTPSGTVLEALQDAGVPLRITRDGTVRVGILPPAGKRTP